MLYKIEGLESQGDQHLPQLSDQMECSICFDEITKATGSTSLSCDHSFHFRCITSWFGKQICDNLEQTCPCCRSKGAEMDRCSVIYMDEENESEDEDYEEEDEEEESMSLPDLGSDELFRWERTGAGQWLVTSNREMAYESLRSLFGPMNELEVEQETPAEIAARKIQAIFRGYKQRRTYRMAKMMLSLNPEALLIM